jgi:hypothetical protein
MPYAILGYAYYGPSVISSAGAWAAVPTAIQLYGAGVPLPGTPLQRSRITTGTVTAGSTVMPLDNTIPQNTEGDLYLSGQITPTSAANLINISTQLHVSFGTASRTCCSAIFQDSTASALIADAVFLPNSGVMAETAMRHTMAAGTTNTTTFNLRTGPDSAATLTLNGIGGSTQYFGGVFSSWMDIEEIMT